MGQPQLSTVAHLTPSLHHGQPARFGLSPGGRPRVRKEGRPLRDQLHIYQYRPEFVSGAWCRHPQEAVSGSLDHFISRQPLYRPSLEGDISNRGSTLFASGIGSAYCRSPLVRSDFGVSKSRRRDHRPHITSRCFSEEDREQAQLNGDDHTQVVLGKCPRSLEPIGLLAIS